MAPAPRLDRVAPFFREHPDLGVIAVYLFGSHAVGRAHRESDVDLGVLLDRTRYPTAAARFEARVWLTSELISVVGCNEADVVILNDAPPLFARRILWEGRQLFLGDPEANHRFLVQIQSQAADLTPWLGRMRRLKLEALAR